MSTVYKMVIVLNSPFMQIQQRFTAQVTWGIALCNVVLTKYIKAIYLFESSVLFFLNLYIRFVQRNNHQRYGWLPSNDMSEVFSENYGEELDSICEGRRVITKR